ncbi:GNAT family N-acetyltransferase [Hyphobacterium sp.]|uniref:GNAT family N-acetyltransferase n=1 Tax=Hyphobacterium sp. TaxID=2004662 RepID=UPI003B52F68E
MQLHPKVLENDYVRLEPMQEGHRDTLRPAANDPDIWANMTLAGFGPHYDSWFDEMMSAQQRNQISHVVFRRSTGNVVGHTAYLAIAAPQQRVEIGWTFYTAGARRTEVNPACKLALFENAFASGAERVELKTGGDNLRSQGAMTKMGAVREGTLRSQVNTWRGKRRDTVYFSVLRSEWPAVRANLLNRPAR